MFLPVSTGISDLIRSSSMAVFIWFPQPYEPFPAFCAGLNFSGLVKEKYRLSRKEAFARELNRVQQQN